MVQEEYPGGAGSTQVVQGEQVYTRWYRARVVHQVVPVRVVQHPGYTGVTALMPAGSLGTLVQLRVQEGQPGLNEVFWAWVR